MSTMPVRNLDQQMAGLALANQIRSLRAQLWRDWKAKGRTDAALDAARMVAEPPAYLLTWRVESLLGRLPTIGTMKLYRSGHHRSGEKIRKWLREMGIPMGTTVGALTPRQRQALCERLRIYADARAWSKYLMERRA